MKKIRVKFSPEAEEIYNYLNKEVGTKSKKTEIQIFNAINKKVGLIKNNFHYGEPIAKSKIPAKWKEKYGITNLFWVELPHFWRMFYSLADGETEIEIIAFVVEILDHKKYNKLFKYKKK